MEFHNFLNQNNKNYLTKEEFNARYKVFQTNLALIRSHKDGDEGYSLDVNKFADMSPEEFE